VTKRCLLLLGLLPVAAACQGSSGLAGLDGVLAGLGGPGGSLDSATVAAGLREALAVGTANAVETTSRTDGFWRNPAIRIPLPEALAPMASTLRGLGLSRQVDELELTMNRAAEQAAGEAAPVFLDALQGMTISDALGILNGGDTAATEYFRSRTSDELRTRFAPIVGDQMSRLGLVQLYDGLAARYAALPLTTTPPVDLRDYVTDRALGGLFTVLGQEETRIREDPAARTTELLQRVFGPGRQ
jgi:hypothetical protein